MKAGDLVMYKIDEGWDHITPGMEKFVGLILSFEVDNVYFEDLYSAVNSKQASDHVVYAVVLWGDDGKKSWEFEHEISVISEAR